MVIAYHLRDNMHGAQYGQVPPVRAATEEAHTDPSEGLGAERHTVCRMQSYDL